MKYEKSDPCVGRSFCILIRLELVGYLKYFE